MAASERDAGAARGGETRTGFATDVHPFGPGDGLWLGGVEIPAAPRLHGHSDGDVALHAIGGALLGAAGLGDLGGIYPADERTRRGIPSSELLGGIVEKLASAAWRPSTGRSAPGDPGPGPRCPRCGSGSRSCASWTSRR